MDVEYEAAFADINKDEVRAKLKDVGAELIKPEFMQKRAVFALPTGHEIFGAWARVRDEGDQITMSIKATTGNTIEDQRESQIIIDSFQEGVKILETIGCVKKAYQESFRELWHYNNAEITIDEWPFLPAFVEVEAGSEDVVRKVSQDLGFDYSKAVFGSVDVQYSSKYNISTDLINNHTPQILFDMENPFVNRKD